MTFTWPLADVYERPLLELLAEWYAANPGLRLGKGGTWASGKSLFDEPRTYPLRDWIRSCIPGPVDTLDGWGLLLLRGDTVREHSHLTRRDGTTNDFAGAYYLSGTSAGGRFQTTAGLDVAPAPGLTVVIPAGERHWVTEYTDDAPRWTIGFSARVDHG